MTNSIGNTMKSSRLRSRMNTTNDDTNPSKKKIIGEDRNHHSVRNHKSSKRKERVRLPSNTILFTAILSAFLATQTFLSTVIYNNDQYLDESDNLNISINLKEKSSNVIDVSVILLTYKKADALALVLPSVFKQQYSNKFEIILADNGCFDDTKAVVKNVLRKQSPVKYKYLPLCNNPGYAIGNNEAAKQASSTSKYFLLLNDDMVLSNTDFIQSMVDLADAKETAAAVGCKILNKDGSEIIEAGSIIWKEGSAAGFGRGRTDIDAPEFSYPKPVDYVSGACLLVERTVFDDYGGFDSKHFPNYYEDTDLQLHIQHDLGKQVWLQPKAVGFHDEHGSFGNDESIKLMEEASNKFYEKWEHALEAKHVKDPYGLDKADREKSFFMAADLRARDTKYANILYFEEKAPNKSRGSGFGRSFDNLSMIADLGHRVTMVTFLTAAEEELKDWCDKACVQEISGLGIEYVDTEELKTKLFESRVGYYDIVIVSRPSTLFYTHKLLQNYYTQSPFSLIYDCEALWFRRNEVFTELVKSENIPFPGYENVVGGALDRQAEIAMISMADTVVTVSKGEKKTIKLLLPEANDVQVIGHIMDADRITRTSFRKRKGIFFLASFSNSMYYNGDAIWYFLEKIYPLIIEYFGSSYKKPIPLTIAGRGIPEELRQNVTDNDMIAPYVTFLESPPTIDHLFEEHRIFIAPHLYGAGIQYKVSEALSVGIPVVMSEFTQQSFGDVPGCVGYNPVSFMQCVIDLHSDESKWEALRKEGISYIERTHSRNLTMSVWSDAINHNFNKNVGELDEVDEEMDEGEKHKLLSAKVNNDQAAGRVLASSAAQTSTPIEEWRNTVCTSIPDHICHEVFVVSDLKVTFCSAAKVASTTTKTYFQKASSSIVIPKNARYGVHEANWTKFQMIGEDARKEALNSPDWTHVFFYKNVLERFVSGYLDKVVNDCKHFNNVIPDHLAIHHYIQYGFTCEEHTDLEKFISFMKTVPEIEGHFHSQTPLCSVGKFPHTDKLSADDTLSNSLKGLSIKLGVVHPLEEKKSSTHSTNARAKLVGMFKGRTHLIEQILDLFREDCDLIPSACYVEDVLDALKEE